MRYVTHVLAHVVIHVLARVLTHVLVLPYSASHFYPHFASTCSNTRASTCYYAHARLLFKNMHPGDWRGELNASESNIEVLSYMNDLQ